MFLPRAAPANIVPPPRRRASLSHYKKEGFAPCAPYGLPCAPGGMMVTDCRFGRKPVLQRLKGGGTLLLLRRRRERKKKALTCPSGQFHVRAFFF